ncbi:nucleoside phosphorylase domain-containing protein [Fusarium redolens]|uniref:Nucleoside phosphorylase domain-containing protein n=1 Tax=Fusarium redolens TaxID=48865 RepID=A0A9P9G3G9_FUSRE|nr:nucleoside phosphorylase domain-containing protein [Fusarium redolens]KAH7231317.1 nucleoside phosphorylase domain-containing protein [Fusarium redolens]
MANNQDYTVGWICALTVEFVAAQAFLDEKHKDPPEVAQNDNNNYALGRIGNHNIVIAVFPDGEYGTTVAATVARDMLHSFPNIRIGLLVGIGGGAPSPNRDIRLGDIVVSSRGEGKGGVFQYDFGKTIQNQSFQETEFLDQPPTVLRTAVSALKAKYELEGHRFNEDVDMALKKIKKRKKYSCPPASSDRLYRSDIAHLSNSSEGCSVVCGDDPSHILPRTERNEEDDNPAIHYGLIASANQLMRDALIRNKLAAEKGVLCFEMEAAGLMNHFPCLIIRGICDYADSHKNKEWQGFAAMVAAAYAKDLLRQIPQNKVEVEKKISEVISGLQDAVSATSRKADTIIRHQQTQEHKEILNWLTPVDYGLQQSDYLGRQQPGTGQWLLASTEFQGWLATSKQTLFCPGIPGAGKTILTSIVVDYLDSRFRHDSKTGMAYIYCNFRRQNEQSIDHLLASVLKQLTPCQPSILDSVKSLYDQHKAKRTRPFLDEIVGFLQSVVAMHSRVFIIVDALDECQASNSCRARFLSELFDLQKRHGANILATSRFIPEIIDRFGASVSLEIRASTEDVARYLENHVQDLPSIVQEDPQLQAEITTGISEAVDGMFLLAQLYLGLLADKLTPNDIRSAMRTFQEQGQGSSQDQDVQVLDHAYRRVMERINEQMAGKKELAFKVLSWITFAKRQLTTSELQHALGTKAGKSEFDHGDLTPIEDIVSFLGADCVGRIKKLTSG